MAPPGPGLVTRPDGSFPSSRRNRASLRGKLAIGTDVPAVQGTAQCLGQLYREVKQAHLGMTMAVMPGEPGELVHDPAPSDG